MRAATRRIGAVYDEALAPAGINIAQYGLLRRVERQGRISLTDLGRVSQLDRSTIGRNVRVLERGGLIDSVRDVEDRRQFVVTLSEAGRNAIAVAEPLWQACQRDVEKRLGAEQMGALKGLLTAF